MALTGHVDVWVAATGRVEVTLNGSVLDALITIVRWPDSTVMSRLSASSANEELGSGVGRDARCACRRAARVRLVPSVRSWNASRCCLSSACGSFASRQHAMPWGSGTSVSPALEVDIANSTVFLIVVFRLAYSKFAEPSSASCPDCHSCYLNTSCRLSRAPPTSKHHVLTTFTHCACVNYI